MSKAVWGVVGVVAVAAAVVVGGSFVTGQRVRTNLASAAVQMPAEMPVARLVSQTYDKGVFSATQTLTFEFGCPPPLAPAEAASAPATPTRITVRHRIKHGPIPGFSSFAAAVVDSDIVVPDAARRDVAQLFGDKAPVSAHTVVAFDGSYTSRIVVPEFQFTGPAGEKFAWQGFEANVSANGWGRGSKVRFDSVLPGMSIAVNDERSTVDLKATGFKTRGDFVVGPSLWLSAGHSEGEIATMAVAVEGHGTAAALPKTAMTFNAFKVVSDTTIENDLLGSTSRISGSGTLGGTKIEKIEVQSSMRRIHVPGFAALMKNAMGMSATCVDKAKLDPQAMAAQMQKDMLALLPYNPEFALDQMAFDLDGKRGSLSYAFGVQGVTAADLQQPMQALFMTKGKASGQIKLPVVWIQKLMATYGGEQGAAAAQPEMLNLMIDQAAGQGFVVRDGEYVSSKASFENGKALVNGKPLGGGG